MKLTKDCSYTLTVNYNQLVILFNITGAICNSPEINPLFNTASKVLAAELGELIQISAPEATV